MLRERKGENEICVLASRDTTLRGEHQRYLRKCFSAWTSVNRFKIIKRKKKRRENTHVTQQRVAYQQDGLSLVFCVF